MSDEELENETNSNGSVIVPKWLLIIVPLVALLVGAGMTLGIQRQTGIQNSVDIRENSQKIKENSTTINQLQMTLTTMQNDIKWIRGQYEKHEQSNF